MSKGNYQNYSLVEKYLAKNNIDYEKLNAYQYRIIGPAAVVDLWPARMTIHVLKTEGVDPNAYFRLSYNFNAKELEAILNGEDRK